MLRCYNIGCGQTYDPNNNIEGSCTYHPIPPLFHDGRKGWECCKKYSTDFSTCLNTPGCTKGTHNPNKPPEEEKPQLDDKFKYDVVVVEPLKPVKKYRPNGDDDMVELKSKILPSLKPALEKKLSELKLNEEKLKVLDKDYVEIGTSCHNFGCKQKYFSSESDKEICVYHSGVAIFHDGMKYWSCCQRKSSEFDAFLDQKGCTTGKHLWRADKTKSVGMSCRFDWFQVEDYVTLSIYSKLVEPSSVEITANSVRLSVKFDYDAGQSFFEKEYELYEAIDVESSHVTLGAAKVEIVLKKTDKLFWKSLEVIRSS